MSVRSYVLAFDTATDRCAVALGVGDVQIGDNTVRVGKLEKVATVNSEQPRKHMQFLLPEVQRLLKENGIGIRDIGLLVCGVGPGSFSGVRLATMTARTLAQFLEAPLLTISTLEVLALGALEALRETDEDLFVITDGKKGELYVHRSKLGEGRTSSSVQYIRKGQLELVPVEGLAYHIADGPNNVLVGDALIAYEGLFTQYFPLSRKLNGALSSPRAEVLLSAAADRDLLLEDLSWQNALPLYLRLSQAEENLQRDGRR